MRPWTWILTGCLLAAGASALTAAFLAPSSRGGTGDEAELVRTLDRLDQLVQGLEAKQRELSAGLAARDAELATPASARSEVGGLDAAVARWMEANADHLAGAATPVSVGHAKPAGETQSVDAIVDLLLRDSLGDVEEQELWDRLRKEGRLDEVVKGLEDLVAERPNDPDLRVELGNAYIQKIFEVGMGPMAGVFGTKADEAFDQALALDPEHWEARFMKAVSLSNWPAFLGKTGEAIAQFETLVGQQESRPSQPEYAQTYYFLGNMYLQTGDTKKALEAWKRGVAVFPDSQLLLGQISTYEAQEGNQ